MTALAPDATVRKVFDDPRDARSFRTTWSNQDHSRSFFEEID